MVEDKLSMANGIETRVPFLDNDLVDFAMKIPTHLKLHLDVKHLPYLHYHQNEIYMG